MDGLSARVRSRRSRVRGDDSRRRRSRRFGVFLFIRLLRDDGDGASSRPHDPRVRRPAAAAAALARDASRGGRRGRASRGCRIVGRGVDDARVTRRPQTGFALLRRRRRRLRRRRKARQPGRRPDARAVRRRRVGARVRRRRRARRPARRTPRRGVGVHSSRRKDRRARGRVGTKKRVVAAAGCAAGNLVAETVGREAAVAVCQLMDCEERGEGGGASRGEGGGRGAADGGSSSAVSSSAVSSAASSALDAATRAFGGNEWTRRVALHLSLDAWVTPAKATLAAALARRPSSREALRGAARRNASPRRSRD